MAGDEGDDAVDETPDETPQRPVLRVVRGDPTPEELAALTVVLAAAAPSGGGEPDRGPTSFWADRPSLVRRPVRPGPGAWVASGRRS